MNFTVTFVSPKSLSGKLSGKASGFRSWGTALLALSLALSAPALAAGADKAAAPGAQDGAVKDGTYVIKIGKKFLGADVYFDLRNGGDTIELPRAEVTLKKNDQGYHVRGCFTMYRGAEVMLDRQCELREKSIYCRTVPDWVTVAPENTNLDGIEELQEVIITPAGKDSLNIKVTDASMSAGGDVSHFSEGPYVLRKNRGDKCRRE